jgi:phosphoribosylformylglycinamidine synthase
VGETELLLIDLGQGRNRLGGSALAQVYGATGRCAGRRRSGQALKAFFGASRQLNRAARSAARLPRPFRRRPVRHRLRNGFATHCGVSLDTRRPLLRPADERRRWQRAPADLLGRPRFETAVRALFNEELGAVIQIRRAERCR